MDKKSREIFYGVVIVATLIIALVGTTLAYFSYRTSSKDEAVKARAATINIVYNDGSQVTAQADELIPSSFEVVKNVVVNHHHLTLALMKKTDKYVAYIVFLLKVI